MSGCTGRRTRLGNMQGETLSGTSNCTTTPDVSTQDSATRHHKKSTTSTWKGQQQPEEVTTDLSGKRAAHQTQRPAAASPRPARPAPQRLHPAAQINEITGPRSAERQPQRPAHPGNLRRRPTP